MKNPYRVCFIPSCINSNDKYRLILLFVLLFAMEMKGQTWPMPGAHWEYCRGGLGTDFRVFEYTRDTLINSTNYQVIEQVNVTAFPNVGAVYTRYSNDTVYRYVQSQEYPFMIFNAQLEEVYSTFRTDFDVFSDSTCRSILPVKVIQLDTVIYGSQTLERWKLVDTLFDDIYVGSAQASTWDIVERIGFMNDFPFTLNFTFSGNNCFLPSDMEEGFVLSYYSDSSYSYVTPWDCSYAIGIDEPRDEVEPVLYPNPTCDVLNISIPNNSGSAYLAIFNIWGEEVFNTCINNGIASIPIYNFPNGLYFVRCTTPNDFSTGTFVVNH